MTVELRRTPRLKGKRRILTILVGAAIAPVLHKLGVDDPDVREAVVAGVLLLGLGWHASDRKETP